MPKAEMDDLVDDRPAAARAHIRNHRLDAQPRAFDVNRHCPVPPVNVDVGQRPALQAGEHRRVVDQNIDPAERRHRCCGHCFGRGRIGYIHPLKLRLAAACADGSGGFLALSLQHVGDQHRSALPHQCFGIGAANPARAAGDDGDFSCE